MIKDILNAEELPLLNPEWFEGNGFWGGTIGYSHWISFHRQPVPPLDPNRFTYWICGEIVRKWDGAAWKLQGRLKIS